MGKIVYHGTWSPKPPHEYGDTFHAGTKQSAQDRLSSMEGIPDGYGHFQAVHAYDIPEELIGKRVHSDPHAGDTYENLWGDRPRISLPNTPKKVARYLNDHEDRGSISYLIPSRLVKEGMIKHLGAQWNVDPSDPRSAPIVNAISAKAVQ